MKDIRRQFEAPDPVRLYVELSAGSVTVTASDTDLATVEVHGPRAEDFAVGAGRNLSVIAPRGRFFGRDAHDVRVTVPVGSDVAVRTGSAGTDIVGAVGSVQVRTGSGDVELELAEGPVVVESGSGGVRIHEARAHLRVKSGSGDVEIGDVAGTAGVSTGSGDVVIGIAHGPTVVKTGSGDLEVKRCEADVSLTTGSGDLRVGHAPRGKVTMKAVSGDVVVGVPTGTPVWTDISSVSGTVRSDVPSAGRPRDGQDHLELRATTVSGNVRLVPA